MPRGKSKEPFRTWDELKQSGKPAPWENLYLRLNEIEELLDWLKKHSEPWFYAFIVMAAHTGARRSEINRSEKQDWDFKGQTVAVREKKRGQVDKVSAGVRDQTELLV